MPFLRFSRDKRGYETTSLVHAFRHRGRAKQRILYWFRTPPNLKVGRPALDEDAIRWIEEHHPDIDFDWQKILEAQPPPPVPADDGRGRRGRREKSDRKKPQPRPGVSQSDAAAPVAALESQPIEALQEMPDLTSEPEAVQALEQLTHPDVEEMPAPTLTPVESVLGREQLTRLRARYAELQARITERGGTPERVEAMRTQAESLNPDTWVTEQEARKGLAEFEPTIRDLRAALGLRRRRRSHRGGRRRRRRPGDQTAGPSVASNAPEAAEADEPADNE